MEIKGIWILPPKKFLIILTTSGYRMRLRNASRPTDVPTSGGRSMPGPDYYNMLRTITDIPTGMQAGLVPKYDNLADMALAGRSAREISIAAGKRLKFLKDNNFQKVVKDLDGGTITVTHAEGNEQTFKTINEARRWVKDNPGSSEPRFEPNVAPGEKVYPGGYGEVWIKDSDGEGWTRVGHRVGPADVVRQFEDFLGRGLSGNTAFEGYQSGLHAVRHAQMIFSFFHGIFESINSTSMHGGEGCLTWAVYLRVIGIGRAGGLRTS